MTALTKTSFQFPKLGSMLDALNRGVHKRANMKSKTFGQSIELGAALSSGHWNSLSDVRRHRPSKYVHHIRVEQEGAKVYMSLMHFKLPKTDNKEHRIELSNAFVHAIVIEHGPDGAIERVSFGMEQGQQNVKSIVLTQSLEGNMARQFVTTLARGWVRGLLPKEEMAMVEANTYRASKLASSLQALMEPTNVMLERAATMHQRMLQSYDNPAAARTLDQAVLHVYEKGDTVEDSAAVFDVDIHDVVSRKAFFDRVSQALGQPASKIVVQHLLQSERDERRSEQGAFHRTPDTELDAQV